MMFTLKEIRPETAEASTFIFTSDTPVVYKPGQHIVLRLPHENTDNRGVTRPFTLSSSPTEEGFVMITTKRGPSSFKQTLFALPIGSTTEAKSPVGNLYLLEDQSPHIMLAGGIGITPFRSMIKYAFDKKLTMPITLLYSNKTLEEVVFKKELDAITTSMPNIKVVYTITQPEDGLPGRRIDEAMIKAYCPDIPNTIFYTAGPTGLVETIIAVLAGMGVPPEHVKFEKFSGY